MNKELIRKALQYSLFLGIHSDLPWFTEINQEALKELEGHKCTCGGQSMEKPTSVQISACTWPPDEAGCSS